MRNRYFLAAVILLPLMFSCKKEVRNPLSVGSVGAPWEVLVVMDKDKWEAPEGRALYDVLHMDVPGLPQSEPMFKVSRCDKADFKGILKPVRNIIETDISNRYSAPKLHFYRDQWATNQAVVKIVAPDNASFIDFVAASQERLYDIFYYEEIERSLRYIRKSRSKDFIQIIRQEFGIEMLVPETMRSYKKADHFFWASNGIQARKRQDLVVYSYPYTDRNTFTLDYLNHKRDSVMKANIPGGAAGSYMGRQEQCETFYRALNVNGKYAAEIRGLWELKGDVMGGPYVSLTRLDEVNNRVVTIEIFVYAPNEEKRNLVRFNEALLYSAKLPGEYTPEEENPTEKE